MKYFRQLISEVAQPKPEDEINFKEKHVIDHIIDPVGEEDQFTADMIKKFYNRADYKAGEDIAVYEASSLTLKRDLPGQEDDDIDNDGSHTGIDKQLRFRRRSQIKRHIIDEAKLDKIGLEDEDINNDGEITSSDRYLHARRKAIEKKLKNEGILKPITPAGGKYDQEKSHVLYKKSNSSKKITESFSSGSLKLKDGSSVKLSSQDAELLNNMFNDLNPNNKKKMQNVLLSDKTGFEEILGFAREAL